MHGALVRTHASAFFAFAFLAFLSTSCGQGHLVLTDQAEARSAATRLVAEFTRANEATHRAVLAEADDQSAAAAKQAEEAIAATQHAVDQLKPLLRTLNYTDELALLEQFTSRFNEFKKLDAEILSLAVENTNLKAQRLAFGAGSEAADAFALAIRAAASDSRSGASDSRSGASDSHAGDTRTLAAQATASVRELQVLQLRHNAEADEAVMGRVEERMKALEADAARDVARVRALETRSAASRGAAAAEALERFVATNAEIVRLSRRNSNVRSLALTLGTRREIAAQCMDILTSLDEKVHGHEFKATR